MNLRAQESGQSAQERICAQRFLNWLSYQRGANYSLQRAEEAYPDLKGRLRWEFVARRKGAAEWVAIEVKRILFPQLGSSLQLDRLRSDWKKLCSQVDTEVQGQLEGVIGIDRPPALILDQRKRKQLVTMLAEVIIREASGLKTAQELRDVGPQIAERFPDWPRTKSTLEEYEHWGEYRPSPVYLIRLPSQGCGVKLLAVGAGGGGDIKEIHQAALEKVFNPVEGVKANKQLGLAKARGAKCAVLLLDCFPVYFEGEIREYLRGLDHDLISEIGRIYSVTNEKVVEVYPCR